jgi:hypothetical protein
MDYGVDTGKSLRCGTIEDINLCSCGGWRSFFGSSDKKHIHHTSTVELIHTIQTHQLDLIHTHNPIQTPKMTTYASYANLSTPTASIYHRHPSSTSSTSITNNNNNQTQIQKKDKEGKWYTFLLPAPESATTTHPGLLYDPVIRRPLFGRAKRGNERTLTERRRSSRVLSS